MKRSASRASKVSTDGQDSLENIFGYAADGKWQEFLEKEENDLFILELREEIVQNCIDICFEAYLQKQAVAFTVYCASLACCKVLNIYYMYRDPGDTEDANVKESWEPDSEPEPAIIDSWGSYSIEPLPFKAPVKIDTKLQKVMTPLSTTASFPSGVESCSFVSDLFDFGEAEEFSLHFNLPSVSSSTKGRRSSLFTRTLSSSLESLSLSCLKIFKMGSKAQKIASDIQPICGSKSDDSFD